MTESRKLSPFVKKYKKKIPHKSVESTVPDRRKKSNFLCRIDPYSQNALIHSRRIQARMW